MLPNFLIIGAARSGTTTLYHHLQTHPDIYLPATKRPEPHFFLKQTEYSQGLAHYEQRFFSAWSEQRAIGEASTSYLYGAEVPRRVAAALPGVKLICLLRNPVERAFSGYWHSVVSGLESLSFDEAIEQEPARKLQLAGTPMGEIAPFAYFERGLYHQQLTRWLEIFERSRFKIILLDDLLGHPQQTCREVASFLGIDPDAFPAVPDRKENSSVPEGASMSSELYRSLAARFRNDVSALEAMLDRDLSHWLDAPSE